MALSGSATLTDGIRHELEYKENVKGGIPSLGSSYCTDASLFTHTCKKQVFS